MLVVYPHPKGAPISIKRGGRLYIPSQAFGDAGDKIDRMSFHAFFVHNHFREERPED